MSLRGALNPLRRAGSAACKLQSKAPVRNMSGGGSLEEEIAEYQKWRTVTFVVVPGLIGFGAYTFANLTHHHAEKPDFEYLKIRNKRYPWPSGDTCLFDKN
mmetsp:Transcript_26134/g.43744  ORF Transcript_26134/g.43744 Transcript_26134/m.43744 type:complete len:101 (-) Transcript_26134:400-702(-)